MSGWVEDSNLERQENKSSTVLPKFLQDLNVRWNLVDLPLVLNILWALQNTAIKEIENLEKYICRKELTFGNFDMTL